MQIRKAEIEDLEVLMNFYDRMNRVINERTHYYNPDNEIYPPLDMVAAAIEKQEQYLGVEDGKIMLACIINSNCPKAYYSVKWMVDAAEEEYWVIHALRVAPEYEGKGYAKQFLSFLLGEALRSDIKAIRLDVLEGYAVEKLYTKCGFKYVDTIEILYDDIGSPKRFRLLEKLV